MGCFLFIAGGGGGGGGGGYLMFPFCFIVMTVFLFGQEILDVLGLIIGNLITMHC